MKYLKNNRGSALVLVIAMIAVTSILGMLAMGVALKNYQNVQNYKTERQTYYDGVVYEDIKAPEPVNVEDGE